MTILPILICGDPVLHNPTEKVTEPFSELHTLIADMFETMDKAHGVGLAANQVGVNKRLFVYNCYDETQDRIRRGCVINPILQTSELPNTPPRKDGSDDEGCLSVPGYSYPTTRAQWARVTGFNEHGEEISIEGEGFFARCLQHETGHLDGFLYTDMLQGRWKRAAQKAIKKEQWTTPGLSWLPGRDPDPFGHEES